MVNPLKYIDQKAGAEQPRVPSGQPGGGQWTSSGGISFSDKLPRRRDGQDRGVRYDPRDDGKEHVEGETYRYDVAFVGDDAIVSNVHVYHEEMTYDEENGEYSRDVRKALSELPTERQEAVKKIISENVRDKLDTYIEDRDIAAAWDALTPEQQDAEIVKQQRQIDRERQERRSRISTEMETALSSGWVPQFVGPNGWASRQGMPKNLADMIPSPDSSSILRDILLERGFKKLEQSRYDFTCEVKLADINGDQDGAIIGYGAVFNLLDRGGDIILPGAFQNSLADWRRRGDMPPMLWQHDTTSPIGVWTDLHEDERGLKVAGELILEVPLAATARALLKRKAIKGLSIGYRTVQSDIDHETGIRKIKELELYEVSLVTVPMMPEATILGVKNDFDAPSWEKAFRDGGLSNRVAKLATSISRKMVLRDGERIEPAFRDGMADVLMALRKSREALRT